MNTLKDKNVVITGATGGLGREIAKVFALEGCRLFLTSTSLFKLEELRNEIKKNISDIKISFCEADLSIIEDVSRVIMYSLTALEKIDILVNCAGIFINKIIQDCNVEEYNQSMDINVRAPFILTRELSKGMIQRKWGRIINISSTSAYNGNAKNSIYCASKHALLGLSRSLSKEFRPHNVRVICICPASLKTKMGEQNTETQDFNTFIEPNEVAEYIIHAIRLDNSIMTDEMRLNRYKGE